MLGLQRRQTIIAIGIVGLIGLYYLTVVSPYTGEQVLNCLLALALVAGAFVGAIYLGNRNWDIPAPKKRSEDSQKANIAAYVTMGIAGLIGLYYLTVVSPYTGEQVLNCLLALALVAGAFVGAIYLGNRNWDIPAPKKKASLAE